MWREMIIGSNYNNRSNFFGSPKRANNRGGVGPRGSPRRDRRASGGARDRDVLREEDDEDDLLGRAEATPLRNDLLEKD